MTEETKEEYIARHRRETGMIQITEITDAGTEKKRVTLKERLTSIFFMLLCFLFLYIILQIFGMMKAN